MTTEEQRAAQRGEHDRLFDQLHESVMRTKGHATTISTELGEQDGMLDNLSSGIEHATFESRRQTQSIGQLLQDTRHRGFYFAVIILILIIIALMSI